MKQIKLEHIHVPLKMNPFDFNSHHRQDKPCSFTPTIGKALIMSRSFVCVLPSNSFILDILISPNSYYIEDALCDVIAAMTA